MFVYISSFLSKFFYINIVSFWLILGDHREFIYLIWYILGLEVISVITINYLYIFLGKCSHSFYAYILYIFLSLWLLEWVSLLFVNSLFLCFILSFMLLVLIFSFYNQGFEMLLGLMLIPLIILGVLGVSGSSKYILSLLLIVGYLIILLLL